MRDDELNGTIPVQRVIWIVGWRWDQYDLVRLVMS